MQLLMRVGGIDHTLKWELPGGSMDALEAARQGGHADCVALVEVRRRLHRAKRRIEKRRVAQTGRSRSDCQ